MRKESRKIIKTSSARVGSRSLPGKVPAITLLVAVLGLIVLTLNLRQVFRPAPDLQLKEIAVPESPWGPLIAIGKNRFYRFDGRVFSWTHSIDGDPEDTLDLLEIASIHDPFTRTDRLAAGLKLYFFDWIRVSPDGDRLLISGGIRVKSKEFVSYNLGVLDTWNRRAWGLLRGSVGSGAWASNDSVVLQGRQIISLKDDRREKIRCNTSDYLRLYGVRDSKITGLEFDMAPFERRGELLLTEYVDWEAGRSLLLQYDQHRTTPGGFFAKAPKAGQWFFVLEGAGYPEAVLLEVNMNAGTFQELRRVSFSGSGRIIPSTATIDYRNYLLLVYHNHRESKLFSYNSSPASRPKQ